MGKVDGFDPRARGRYGGAQSHLQFAVIGEARFYRKAVAQNSQKL
ncbi:MULTISPECIES: hypothetical protein [unclassified Mesorhizobium]|nr:MULTISPECIES: hypothetical protein [unclassified Mesorhizobium]